MGCWGHVVFCAKHARSLCRNIMSDLSSHSSVSSGKRRHRKGTTYLSTWPLMKKVKCIVPVYVGTVLLVTCKQIYIFCTMLLATHVNISKSSAQCCWWHLWTYPVFGTMTFDDTVQVCLDLSVGLEYQICVCQVTVCSANEVCQLAIKLLHRAKLATRHWVRKVGSARLNAMEISRSPCQQFAKKNSGFYMFDNYFPISVLLLLLTLTTVNVILRRKSTLSNCERL